MILLISMASVASAEESGDEFGPPGMVKVEPPDLLPPKKNEHDYVLRSYQERRGGWGAIFGIAYSSFNPTNYASAFLAQNFTSIYGNNADTPLLEGQLVVKENFSFGSIGIEGGVGYYDTTSGSTLIVSELQFMELRLGVILILDTLFQEPYVAPYASAGAYTIFFNETMQGNAFGGNTQVAPYFTVGLQATLDWIDTDAARVAYNEGRIQSTFLFAEVRTYVASAAKTDANFGANFVPGGGIRLEF